MTADLRQTNFDYVTTPYLCPSGHNQSNPLVINETGLGHVVLDSVRLTFPLGQLWVCGWSLLLSGQQIVPQFPVPQFIVGNYLTQDYPIGLEVDSGLQVAMYNLGSFAHTVYATYKVYTVPVPGESAPPGADAAVINPAVATPSTIATSAPITTLAPVAQPSEAPPVSTITSPVPTIAADVDVLALYNQVQAQAQQITALQTELATVMAQVQQLSGQAAPSAPSSSGIPSSTPPSSGTGNGSGATSPVSGGPTTAPSGPTVQLPPAGQVVTNPDGSAVNPYNANGSLNIDAVGQIAAAQGGKATIITPSGASIPVTTGTLGGHPYTCIGSSC